MGHHYSFACNVGHLRSRLNSVKLLVYDGMRQYPEYQYCITDLIGQYQPEWNEVKGMSILLMLVYVRMTQVFLH